LGLERTGWDPGSIDAVAYAFFDGDGEARLINEALARDAEIHSRTCTWESLQRLKTASANGYQVDRSKPIPGFLVEAQEFMPRKAGGKRFGYKRVTRFARLDWRCHRRYFKQWAAAAIADHHLRTRQLYEGLAQYGLEGKLRRFNHHDTHAANAFYASGFEEA